MNWQKIIYLGIGVAFGFVVGFLFADTANRKEHEKLRAEVARLRQDEQAATSQSPKQANETNLELPNLTDEQLRKAVERADANPNDPALQRVAGQALHYYAVEKNNDSILPEAARILRRAHQSNPKDVDILLRLANALYILARSGDAARMSEARGFLEKAATLKPEDADIRASIGLTYFYDKPSDPRKAVLEYRKALKTESQNEMALQNLGAALVAMGELKDAEQTINDLEKVNSMNESLPNLRAQLAQKRNALRNQN